MAKFILYIATSIDGCIARSDGSIDWLPLPDEGAEDGGYNQFFNSIDVLVMGSKTYEQVLGFGDWPYPGKLTYVLTTRPLSTAREDVVFIQGGIEEVRNKINQKGGKRVWLVGGGRVAAAFMQQGLVDEYVITVIPIILGSGISLYQSVPELPLELLAVKSYPMGMVELHYQRQQKPVAK